MTLPEHAPELTTALTTALTGAEARLLIGAELNADTWLDLFRAGADTATLHGLLRRGTFLDLQSLGFAYRQVENENHPRLAVITETMKLALEDGALPPTLQALQVICAASPRVEVNGSPIVDSQALNDLIRRVYLSQTPRQDLDETRDLQRSLQRLLQTPDALTPGGRLALRQTVAAIDALVTYLDARPGRP